MFFLLRKQATCVAVSKNKTKKEKNERKNERRNKRKGLVSAI
jgi:hypothetical protein